MGQSLTISMRQLVCPDPKCKSSYACRVRTFIVSITAVVTQILSCFMVAGRKEMRAASLRKASRPAAAPAGAQGSARGLHIVLHTATLRVRGVVKARRAGQ